MVWDDEDALVIGAAEHSVKDPRFPQQTFGQSALAAQAIRLSGAERGWPP